MAVKASNQTKTESFITYKVVKAHDGLNEGEIIKRKACDSGARYCEELGLWKRVEE